MMKIDVIMKVGEYGRTVSLVRRADRNGLYLRWHDPSRCGGKGGYAWRALRHSDEVAGEARAREMAASLTRPAVGSAAPPNPSGQPIVPLTDKDWSRLYSNTRENAKRRNVPFDLTREEFRRLAERSAGSCELTNIPFSGEKIDGCFRRPWAPSVDRVDNAKGYSMENCRIVCGSVNIALHQWGLQVLLRIANGLAGVALPGLEPGTSLPKSDVMPISLQGNDLPEPEPDSNFVKSKPKPPLRNNLPKPAQRIQRPLRDCRFWS